MRIKKTIGKIHLWLGLASGLVVFIVALTGCIYAFEKEIRDFTERYQFVVPQNKPYLMPTQLKAIAEKQLPGYKVVMLRHPGPGKAAIAAYWDEKEYWLVFMDPYSGQVLNVKDMHHDFFHFIIDGHYHLWLPFKTGQAIVAWSTFIFVILLVSGLILWWPRHWNRSSAKGSLTINLKNQWKVLNYDLHNVLGFYSLLFALIIALTGMVWGLEWFSKSSYWLTSGGKALPEKEQPASDTSKVSSVLARSPADLIWERVSKEYHDKHGSLSLFFPALPSNAISVTFNPEPSMYYKSETRYFDQYTLKELAATGIFGQPYGNAPFASKLRRMNYDIHTGAILGLPGKILAFFVSLIVASLPITGLYIWLGKKRKKKVL